ncbi:hypothetical protein [Amycolatopsis sp. cmx-4-68]|uniref:hypothetical protein n=1 Tax=Amycolatopsis sp. cmx-4-68 TaxID=2790938 RepID=UPI003979E520
MILHEPDEAILLELGRLAWTSMNLETHALWVCALIDAQINDQAISARLSKAKSRLDPSSQFDHVRAWIDRTVAAIDEERNQVLHAMPLFGATPDSPAAFDMLGVLPKAATSKRPARHARQRPLTVAELSSARERLEGVYGESDEIIFCLASWRKTLADRQV